MGASSSANRRLRFGDFEIDTTNRKLRKRGRVVRLQPKQFTLLLILAEHAGQIVSRDEIRNKIWDPNTFVDFERSINFAINQVRAALGDSAEKPRFIETIPRLGYRFLRPVEIFRNPSEPPQSPLRLPGNAPQVPVPAEAKVSGEAGGGPSSRAFFDAVAPGKFEPPVKLSSGRFGLPRGKLFSAIALSTLLTLVAGGLGWRLMTSHAIRPPKPASLASQKTDPQTRTVPLTYFTGQMGNPTFSPNGKEIAFVWDGSDHKQLNVYTLPVGGDQPYQVTHFGSKMTDLSWSPDGQSLVYSRCVNHIGGIYAVPALGGPEHKLTGIQCTAANSEAPQYTPDGRFLVFHDDCGTDDPWTLALVVMSLDTGKKRCITTPPSGNWDMYFRLAPDGTKVAFVRAANAGVGDYYVVSISGGTALRLVSGEVLPSGIMWSPDSRRIIFRSGHNGVLGDHLSQVPPTGGEIKAELNYTKLGAMSPDGRRVAYVEDRGGEPESIWQIKLSGPGGSVISHRKITESIGDGSPQLSQDGDRLAFASIRSGSMEVWTSDAEGKNPVKLTSFGGEIVGTPRWSPDGKWIVFDRRPATSSQLHLMNADGGDPHLLIRTHVGDDNDVGSWSRDGKSVYFNSSRGGEFQLWKQQLTPDKLPDGEAIQVTHKGGFTGFESYDGKTIYYTQNNEEATGIWSIPIAGGPEVRVTPAPQCWGDWGISETGLYMLDRAAAPKPTIEFYNFNTRRITPVTQITGTSLCVSPGIYASRDGRTVLYTQFVPPTNYIFMSELLR
jgi:Tol biopolymer transport system component/DNA-binding winged helix-turn-helix (wHTH) protein